jgi:DNA-binding CsgD family transcriptional regulator
MATKLTKSELDVIKNYLKYNAAAKVAQHTGRSTRTVNFHCKNINEKMGTKRIQQSCVAAIRRGLAQKPENPAPILLSNLTPTYRRRCLLLWDNNCDIQKVADMEGVSIRTMHFMLNTLSRKHGTLDVLDLLTRIENDIKA